MRMGGGKALKVSDRGSERFERPPAGGSEKPPSHEMEVVFWYPPEGGARRREFATEQKENIFFEGVAGRRRRRPKKKGFCQGPCKGSFTLDKKFFFVTGSKGECRAKATGVRTKPRAYLWRGFVKLWLLL